MSSDDAIEDEASLPALWAALRHFLDAFVRDIGGPALIAKMGWLGPKFRAEILAWLAPIETLLRRLIFIDAAALIGILPPPASCVRAHAAPKRGKTELDAERPETWPVRFRVLVGAAPARAGAGNQANARRRLDNPLAIAGLVSAWPLAERCEALLRACDDPAPHARRLALALRRRPAHAVEFARAQPSPRGAPVWRFGQWHIARAGEHAQAARAAFIDTS